MSTAAAHRCRLINLKTRKDLNNHVAELLTVADGEAGSSSAGRQPVRVSGQLLSVPEACCEHISAVTDLRLSRHDADPATLRSLLTEALLASTEQKNLDMTDLVECVLSWLVVPMVDKGSVRAVGASSMCDYGPCHYRHTLDPSPETWWISSDEGAELGGRGQWVEYELGPRPVLVDYFHMTIPPLPSGPLSVRVFYLEAANEREGPWECATADLMTLDVPHRQWWALCPPVEARFVRVVCLDNAASHAARARAVNRGRAPSSVGFFEAGFAPRLDEQLV